MLKVTLPTAEEIRQLPRWAVVAFAARCARLAQPYFLKNWPDAPQKYIVATENAIQIAEKSATRILDEAYATLDSVDPSYAGSCVYASVAAAISAARAAFNATANIRAATYTSASTTKSAAYSAANAEDYASATATLYAAEAALASAEATGEGVQQMLQAIRRDFNHLLSLAKQQKWTDATSVPPSVFDYVEPPIVEVPEPTPTIAEQEPADQPETELKLNFYIRDGVNPDLAREKILAVYKALNDLSLAKYGKGLDVKDFTELVQSGVPVGGPK